MTSIFVYPLKIQDEQALEIPPDAVPLTVTAGRDKLLLHVRETGAVFDPKTTKPRTIFVCGDGGDVVPDAARYVGSARTALNDNWWHVFEGYT